MSFSVSPLGGIPVIISGTTAGQTIAMGVGDNIVDSWLLVFRLDNGKFEWVDMDDAQVFMQPPQPEVPVEEEPPNVSRLYLPTDTNRQPRRSRPV